MRAMKSLVQWASKSWLRYVVVIGVGFWGSLTAIIVTLLTSLMGEPFVPARLPMTFLGLWIAGIFWGLAMWFIVVHRKNSEQP
jgi:hypothetical protein